jgi:hypothetical protein
MKAGMIWPNKPDAANPAIASSFGAKRHWRRVADTGRSATLRTSYKYGPSRCLLNGERGQET